MAFITSALLVISLGYEFVEVILGNSSVRQWTLILGCVIGCYF